MRKIKTLDVAAVDTQKCLEKINGVLGKLGITEADVISISSEWDDEPIGFELEKESLSPAQELDHVTIRLFYWG